MDFNGFHNGLAHRKIRLPTYAFQRRTLIAERAVIGRQLIAQGITGAGVIATVNAPVQTASPLLGVYHRLPQESVFHNLMDPQSIAMLRDHVVCGKIIMPFVFDLSNSLEAALVVLPSRDGSVAAQIDELLLSRSVVFGERIAKRLTDLVVSPDGNCEFYVQKAPSLTDSIEIPTEPVMLPSQRELRSACRVSRPDVQPLPPLALHEIRARCNSHLAHEDFYTALTAAGFNFGPSLRLIASLWSGSNETLAELAPADWKGFNFYPLWFDAALQSCASLVTAQGVCYAPVGVRRFVLYKKPEEGQVVFTHSVRTSDGSGDSLTFDITVSTADGSVLAVATQVRLQRLQPGMLEENVDAEELNKWLYDMAWDASQAVARSDSAATTWLVVGNTDAASGQALVGGFNASGRTVFTARHIPGEPLSQVGPTQFTLDVSQGAAISALLRNTTLSACTGVVFLPFSGEDAVDLTNAASFILLLQHLAQPDVTVHAKQLAVITHLAVGAIATDRDLRLNESTLWGVARVAALELPRFNCRAIDTDADAASLSQLVAEITGADPEEVAYRTGQRFVLRLSRSHFKTSPKVLRSLLSEDGDPAPVRLTITEKGVLDNLKYVATKRGVLSDNEVEVLVRATGLNFRDVMGALGAYPGDAGEMGIECSGIVSRVGKKVSRFAVGDEVFGLTQGSFATYCVVDEHFIAQKPQHVTFAEAATLSVTFLTVIYGLQVLAKVQKHDRVLIHAATGGVGSAAVQYCRKIGCEVFATANLARDEKKRFLEEMGIPADHIMNSRTYDFSQQILQLTGGKGVDVVLNSLSAHEFIPKTLACTAQGCRFVEIGKAGIWTPEQMRAARPDVQYMPFDLFTITHESPELVSGMFAELVSDLSGKVFAPLAYHTFGEADVISAFRFMSGGKHMGKIVVERKPAKRAWDTDGSYLVTGAFGSLGLIWAQRLVQRGVRHLVLSGRREPTGVAAEAVVQMRQRGVTVTCIAGDVAKYEDVERMVAIEPPVRGIFHSAGVLSDALIPTLTPDSLALVCGPKVAGGWNLHRVAEKLPQLAQFVLFSSIASVMGNPGQANYAAANAFLDSLAHRRRASGLPAVSLNWGPWAEGGMAAGVSLTTGVARIPPHAGLLALEALLTPSGGVPSQLVVAPIQWPTLLGTLAAVPPKLINLHAEAKTAITAAQTQPRGTTSIASELAQLSNQKRHAHLLAYLQAKLVSILGLDRRPEEVNPMQPVAELGLDSLLAMELRNTLHSSVGVTLAPTALFEHPSLAALTTHIIAELRLADVTRADEPATSPTIRAAKLRDGASGTAVFCIQGAGGSTFTQYTQLAKALTADVTVFEFITGDAEIGSVEATARLYVQEIDRLHPAPQPVAIVGWSYGGVVAYEIVQLLVAARRTVKCLTLLDWMEGSKFSPTYDPELAALGAMVKSVEATTGQDSGLSLAEVPTEFTSWSFTDKCSWLLDTLQARSFLSATADRSQYVRQLRSFRSAVSSLRDYRARAFPISVSTLAFECTAQLQDVNPFDWQRFDGNLDLQTTVLDQCNHWQFLRSPFVEEIASALDTKL
eukprot:TRINITY_DN6711_c0_g2_i1.p1 TRINITY_DN6711_c0_g2~~TRINITY_DN6711_c0_g2_i1.p1  ORF type:complete len:1701 (+),score=265.73 TRINITY_DN6711_c0_g2_i1:423-5105(+)